MAPVDSAFFLAQAKCGGPNSLLYFVHFVENPSEFDIGGESQCRGWFNSTHRTKSIFPACYFLTLHYLPDTNVRIPRRQ